MQKSSEPERPVVSVWGSSATAPQDPAYASAVTLGRRLAQSGAAVASGGYGGIMEAVSRGAYEAGGRTIGYTVASFRKRGPNSYLSSKHECGDLYERLGRLIHDSDALVALNGGIGTIAEVVLAWNELYLGLIEPRPLIVVGDAWDQALKQLSELMEITPAHDRVVTRCKDVDAVIEELSARGILR